MKGKALFGVPRGRGKAAWGIRDIKVASGKFLSRNPRKSLLECKQSFREISSSWWQRDAENTRAHTLSFFPSLGRSMIEMLGVLAIIGVLSAGGIMGYTAAMENYRFNQTVDMIQKAVGGSANLFTRQSTKGYMIYEDELAQLGILKPEQVKEKVPCTEWGNGYEQKQTCFLSPMKTMMKLQYYAYWNAGEDTHKGARVSVDMHEVSKKDCIRLASHNWLGMAPYVNFVAHSHSWRDGSVYNRTLTTKQAEEYCDQEKGTFRIWFLIHGKLPLQYRQGFYAS